MSENDIIYYHKKVKVLFRQMVDVKSLKELHAQSEKLALTTHLLLISQRSRRAVYMLKGVFASVVHR